MKKLIFITIFFAFAYTNVQAQCFLDRHNTTWMDGWISCTASMNPNPARGESHWILYNFNEPYELFQLHVWNTNAPDYLMDGMNDIVIDISTDGVSWTQVGEFQVPMADGTSTYEGIDLFDFEGVDAQYLLITGLTNHGGACFGLSEIRVDVTDGEIPVVDIDEPATPDCLSARIFPNPVTEASKAIISSTCSNAPIYYSIQDNTGKTLAKGEVNPVGEEVQLDLNEVPIVSGSYILSLQQGGVIRRIKMVKVD